MSLSKELESIFIAQWSQEALLCENKSFSYGGLYCAASGVANWIAAQGIESGDRVALQLPNSLQFAIAYLACIIGGYSFTPINIELSEAEQTYILNRICPKLVIADAGLLDTVPANDCKLPSFPEGVEELEAIFFTSGTTGKPKGVRHNLRCLFGNAQAFNKTVGLNATTRMYHVLPMSYMAGFLNTLLCPWAAGGVAILGPRFTPATALNFWCQPIDQKANTIWLTPTIAAVLVRMSRDPAIAEQVGKQFKHIFCGTAPLTSHIREGFLKTFQAPLQESYGMSEVLFVSVQMRDEATRSANVGRLLEEISLTHEAAEDLHTKELVIHTPWKLVDYLLEHEQVLLPFNDKGGMPTGDIGELIDDRLKITGRLKDLIIRGGVNVSPIAIEEVLSKFEQVKDVAVIGTPDKVWGEAITACVVPNAALGRDKLQNALRGHCKEHLAVSMRPDHYIWLDELPRSNTGKVLKLQLREEFQ